MEREREMKETSIAVARIQRGYIPMWDGAEIMWDGGGFKTLAAEFSYLCTVEVREYVPAVAEFSRRHFRVLIEGPEGSFGWDVVPHPTRGAECVLAVNSPDWGEFFSSLRIGPTILHQLNENELDKISSRFPADIGIPGGIHVYPQPENIWDVDDATSIIHVIEPGSAWHRTEAIDIEPGLYRAQRMKGRMLLS